jgi:hypothetical protein
VVAGDPVTPRAEMVVVTPLSIRRFAVTGRLTVR